MAVVKEGEEAQLGQVFDVGKVLSLQVDQADGPRLLARTGGEVDLGGGETKPSEVAETRNQSFVFFAVFFFKRSLRSRTRKMCQADTIQGARTVHLRTIRHNRLFGSSLSHLRSGTLVSVPCSHQYKLG